MWPIPNWTVILLIELRQFKFLQGNKVEDVSSLVNNEVLRGNSLLSPSLYHKYWWSSGRRAYFVLSWRGLILSGSPTMTCPRGMITIWAKWGIQLMSVSPSKSESRICWVQKHFPFGPLSQMWKTIHCPYHAVGVGAIEGGALEGISARTLEQNPINFSYIPLRGNFYYILGLVLSWELLF